MELHGVAHIDVEQIVADEAGSNTAAPQRASLSQYCLLLTSILSRL